MNYVIVRVYDDYISAHIALGQLTEEQINGWLKDENTVSVDPAITYAVGGIKLMVPEVQAERASRLLRVSENKLNRFNPCPNCSSMNFIRLPKKKGFFDTLFHLLGLKTEKPEIPQFLCGDCHTRFTQTIPLKEVIAET